MEFIYLATAHFLALLSPGPDFFLIMQAGLRLPIRYGIAICAGIASANAVYLFCAVLGLQVIQNFSWLLLGLRVLGVAYLVFLGVMLLRNPRQSVETSLGRSGPEPGERKGNELYQQHRGRQYLLGFMSGILNPKNMIFYLSLFTVLVSVSTPLYVRAGYALWMVAVVFFWDCAVLILIGQDWVKVRLGRGIFYVEKVSGLVLLCFGLALLLNK